MVAENGYSNYTAAQFRLVNECATQHTVAKQGKRSFSHWNCLKSFVHLGWNWQDLFPALFGHNMLGRENTSIQPINIYIWNRLWKFFGNFHQGVNFAVTSQTANFELFGLSCLIVRISQRSKIIRRV